MTSTTSHFRELVLLIANDLEDSFSLEHFSSSTDTEISLLQKSSSELDSTFT